MASLVLLVVIMIGTALSKSITDVFLLAKLAMRLA
jgi:hypothetical protein